MAAMGTKFDKLGGSRKHTRQGALRSKSMYLAVNAVPFTLAITNTFWSRYQFSWQEQVLQLRSAQQPTFQREQFSDEPEAQFATG